ncbi:MAG: 2-enoyl thioester reductase domain-containing protein [Verrucomicrobiota bacterium]
MSQLVITRTGPPAEVLELQPQPRPVPGPGEVLIRMQAAAINPADLNFIEGTYGTKPNLPCVPGMEGVGVIEALGEGVNSLVAGSAVLPLTGPGNWASWRILPVGRVHGLPKGLEAPQAALLRVNPATAWGLLHAAGTPAGGAWVVQNAASSAAGHCVIQIAKSLGLRTLSFVRRPESIAVCEALGADLVFVDDAEGLAAARTALAARAAPAPLLALNAVGGDSALRLMDLLGPHGTHVTYGAMARQPLKVPNGILIFKGLTLRGFWLTHWAASLGDERMTELYQKLAGLALQGQLRQQIAATYPLEQFRVALKHAAGGARNGKILLTFPEEVSPARPLLP